MGIETEQQKGLRPYPQYRKSSSQGGNVFECVCKHPEWHTIQEKWKDLSLTDS